MGKKIINKICYEYLEYVKDFNSIIKRQVTIIKSGKHLNRHLSKEGIHMVNKIVKMFHIFSHQGNANEKHNMMPLHTH